jgi:hypothetical protein
MGTRLGPVYLSYPPLLEAIFVSGKAEKRRVADLHKRLTNGSGTHLNSWAGREAVKYRDVFHTTPPGAKIAPALRVVAEKASIGVARRLFRMAKLLSSRLDRRFFSSQQRRL